MSEIFSTLLTREIFSDGNDVGCLGDNYCPPQCTCTGTIVRCSHAKLLEIPKVRNLISLFYFNDSYSYDFYFQGIPAETSELYLDVNQISNIDTGRLYHLKSLTRL